MKNILFIGAGIFLVYHFFLKKGINTGKVATYSVPQIRDMLYSKAGINPDTLVSMQKINERLGVTGSSPLLEQLKNKV